MRDLQPPPDILSRDVPDLRADLRSAGAGQPPGGYGLRLADAERVAARALQPTRTLDRPDLASGPDEILDLPEPVVEPRSRAAAGRDTRTSNDTFDYSAWSAELDDLLKRPLLPTHRQRALSQGGAVQGGPAVASANAALPVSLAITPEDAPAFLNRPNASQRTKRRAVVMPVLALAASSLFMAAIIGGTVLALAAPESRLLLSGAGQWLGQWQIAISR